MVSTSTQPMDVDSIKTANKIMQFAFPYTPTTTTGLVSLLFWHSVLLTSTTPLFRALNKHWRGEHTLYFVVSYLAPSWVTQSLEGNGIIHPGIEYPAEGEVISNVGPTTGIDRAFALHAGFSMLWIFVSYFQMCHAHKFHPKMHKYFGYVSFLSFAGHMFGASHNVYTDSVRHTALPKIILLLSLWNSAVKLVIAISIARRKAHGWLQAHKDYMMACWVNSLNGAGPIRTISQVQLWFNCGPVLCQSRYSGMATQCQVVYVNRMFLIGLFSMYTYGMHVKIRNDAKLTVQYIQEARLMLIQAFSTFALSYLPHSDWMLHQVFGEPRTLQNTMMVLFSIVAMVVLGIREYRTALLNSAPCGGEIYSSSPRKNLESGAVSEKFAENSAKKRPAEEPLPTLSKETALEKVNPSPPKERKEKTLYAHFKILLTKTIKAKTGAKLI